MSYLSRVMLVLSLSFALAACGGGGGGSDSSDQPAYDAGPAFTQASTTVFESSSYSLTDVSEDDDGIHVIRTQLGITFKDRATTEQVNTLLQDINATIIASVEGIPTLLVKVPDPGSLQDLADLATDIEENAIVKYVELDIFPSTDITEEPVPFHVVPGNYDDIAHHLAVKSHRAWAVQDLITQSPEVIVMDYFGDGSPNRDINYSPLGALDVGDWRQNNCVARIKAGQGDFGECYYNEHGYHVTGIIAGSHPNQLQSTLGRNQVLGMYPSKINLTTFDFQRIDSSSIKERMKLQHELRTYAGDRILVLNASLGRKCRLAGITLSVEGCSKNLAAEWLWFVQNTQNSSSGFFSGKNVEDYVVIVASAGNIKSIVNDTNDIQARWNSLYAGAALRSDLTYENAAGEEKPLSPLNNTLVVENARWEKNTEQQYVPKCISDKSFLNGNIAAIGSNVYSITDANNDDGINWDLFSGTSMAAPQVAGLAALLISIDSELTTAQAVVDKILATTQSLGGSSEGGCASNYSSDIIDAYAAILATDNGLDDDPAIAPQAAPVRFELLDINNDGAFDEKDLEEFASVYDSESEHFNKLEYSKYDLNGDGHTGGPNSARFDLDMFMSDPFSGAPEWDEEITQILEDGSEVTYDETNVNDVDVLCYYAQSALYSGIEDSRNEFNISNCTDSYAFITSDGNIYSGNANGKLNTIATTRFYGYAYAVMSPSLKHIYVRETPGSFGNSKAYILDAKTKKVVLDLPDVSKYHLDTASLWSSDGLKVLAPDSNREHPKLNLVNVETGKSEMLVDTANLGLTDFASVRYSSLSPDEKHLVFAADGQIGHVYNTETHQLHVIKYEGQNLAIAHPIISGDSETLFFLGIDGQGGLAIYSYDLSSKQVSQLFIDTKIGNANISVNSEKTKIIFHQNWSDNNLWNYGSSVLDLSDSSVTPLFDSMGVSVPIAAFLPDGKHIIGATYNAYDSEGRYNESRYILMDVDTFSEKAELVTSQRARRIFIQP